MNTAKQVAKLVELEAPQYYRFLIGVAKAMKVEDLDFFAIFSGMEGSGKSNVMKMSFFTIAHLLKKKISVRKNWYFSGVEYINSLKEIARDICKAAGIPEEKLMDESFHARTVLDTISMKEMDKMKKKWKWEFKILDEAQDLMVHDALTKFNKDFTKIMMAIREFNLILGLAFPDITLLNRYVRSFRVKLFNYSFMLPDGSRAIASYTRRKYVKIITDKPKTVQTYSLLGDLFIDRYRPNILEQTFPKFPHDTKEYKDYMKLKRVSMAKIVFKSSEKQDKSNDSFF